MEIRNIIFVLLGILSFAQCIYYQRTFCPPLKNESQPKGRTDKRDILMNLRREMRRVTSVQAPPVDAYIVTSDDEHQSEYVAKRDRRLNYVTGFTGSTGLAVVTATRAALFVPDLYALQADQEISCDWELINVSNNERAFIMWVQQTLDASSRIGADPVLLSNSQWEFFTKNLNTELSIYLVAVKNNLVDMIWPLKPSYSRMNATVWPESFAGKSWQSKLSTVRNFIRTENCDAIVITALDEIAWLLNIRGRDIPYLPVIKAYVIVTKDQLHLYTNMNKIDSDVKKHLMIDNCSKDYCARLHPYEKIWDDLRTLSQIWKRVYLPSESVFNAGVSRAIYTSIPVEKRKSGKSPIVFLKAEKNRIEREGIKNAHIRDAAIMCEFIAYLEHQITLTNTKWDEVKVRHVLNQFRSEVSLFEELSFGSIVAFGPHGALPHYEPTNATNISVDQSNLLVIDSGSHYLDGTTDLTRTFHFGHPSKEQIEEYTRVLLGSIELATLEFPATLVMDKIDILARAPLWRSGKDYQHGTGHGIGAFLAVHEGPILISYNTYSEEVFREGYFFSNEPGYYRPNKYGIRLENILEVVQKIHDNNQTVKYLGFETVSLVPFEPKLIDYSKLGPLHVDWLNKYNKQIRDKVGEELKKKASMQGFYWMMDRAHHIDYKPLNRAHSLKMSFFYLVVYLIFYIQ